MAVNMSSAAGSKGHNAEWRAEKMRAVWSERLTLEREIEEMKEQYLAPIQDKLKVLKKNAKTDLDMKLEDLFADYPAWKRTMDAKRFLDEDEQAAQVDALSEVRRATRALWEKAGVGEQISMLDALDTADGKAGQTGADPLDIPPGLDKRVHKGGATEKDDLAFWQAYAYRPEAAGRLVVVQSRKGDWVTFDMGAQIFAAEAESEYATADDGTKSGMMMFRMSGLDVKGLISEVVRSGYGVLQVTLVGDAVKHGEVQDEGVTDDEDDGVDAVADMAPVA